MSLDPRPADRPTMACGVCQLEVPAGSFCGYCGDRLQARRHEGPKWLRPRAFSASPGEHLLTPNLVSTLFPQLPPRSRVAFLIGLAVLLTALLATTVLRLPAALITVAALGFPLLFLIYLQEADAHQDIPSSTLVLTSALGIGFGVGWVLLTGAAIARSYDVALGTGIAGYRLREGVGVSIGAMLVMLLPVLLIRLRPIRTQEALDGFALGALGALMFTAAATMTRLAPLFSAGMIDRNRPMQGLMVEAGIRGVAVPVTAACVGGLIGLALWFRRPVAKKRQHRNYLRLVLASMGCAVMVLYAAVGLVDVVRMPQWLQLTAHMGIAAIALLALRIGIQLALLHEDYDDPDQDQPILCGQCGHVVPDMPFCVVCGAATHASSRSSRRFRRDHRPVPHDHREQP